MAGLAIAADYQELLTRCAVPARPVVVDARVAGVHALDEALAQRTAALDDSPAHGRKYGGVILVGNEQRRRVSGDNIRRISQAADMPTMRRGDVETRNDDGPFAIFLGGRSGTI